MVEHSSSIMLIWYRSAESLRNLPIVVVLTLTLTASLLALAHAQRLPTFLCSHTLEPEWGAAMHIAVALLLTA